MCHTKRELQLRRFALGPFPLAPRPPSRPRLHPSPPSPFHTPIHIPRPPHLPLLPLDLDGWWAWRPEITTMIDNKFTWALRGGWPDWRPLDSLLESLWWNLEFLYSSFAFDWCKLLFLAEGALLAYLFLCRSLSVCLKQYIFTWTANPRLVQGDKNLSVCYRYFCIIFNLFRPISFGASRRQLQLTIMRKTAERDYH